ncbi:MAG: calcium-binding protein [Sulfitobacter dubius]
MTVEAGATVNGNGHSIVSFGTLTSVGSETAHAVFNRVNFMFGNSAPGMMEIDHAVINGGAFLPPTGRESYGSFSLTNNVISSAGQSYIWYPTSNSVIAGNVFVNSGGVAVGTHQGVQVSISDNAFINATRAINGSSTIVVWASYGEAVEISGNSFLSNIPAIEVIYSSSNVTGGQNYFGTTDAAIIDTLILDSNDDLSRPSVIDVSSVASGPSDVVIEALTSAGDNVVQALAGMGFFLGSSEDEYLTGTDGADTLFGGGGNDTLNGGLGADTLLGGEGDDTIIFNAVSITYPSPTDIGLIDGGNGFDVLDLSHVSPTSLGLVRLADDSFAFSVSVGSQRFSVTGIEEVFLGNGDNRINTDYAGSITIHSGSGDDRIYVTPDSGEIQNVYGGGGDDDFFVSGRFGSTASGIIDGGAGSNILRTNILFTVDLAAGTAVSGGASYSIANFDTVVVTAHLGYVSTVYGDAGDNSFSVNPLFNDGTTGTFFDGRGGNDILAGGAGADTLNGGAGIDTLDYSAATVGVAVDLLNTSASGGDAEGDVISNFENVIGGAGNDTLVGDAGSNLLSGGAGDDTLDGGDGSDTLDGGIGADTMAGGTGNDSYVVDDAGDIIVEGADAGIDHVDASVTFSLRDHGQHIETLALTGNANINGAGNDFDNTLTGNAGDNVLGGARGNDTLYGGPGSDTLDGGTGADVMAGGTGDDRYLVDDLEDTIIEDVGAGMDHVDASVTFSLRDHSQHIEALSLTGNANINGTGNGLDNILTGNAGDNILDGALGNDSIDGGDGNDLIFGGDHFDTVNAGAGNDTVFGGNGRDLVFLNQGDDIFNDNGQGGDLGRDTVLGGFGNDTINGGGGDDELHGQEGDDSTFGGMGDDQIFGGAGEDTLRGGGGNDTIFGGDGRDLVFGGTGDDVFNDNAEGGENGQDTVYAGFGNDTLNGGGGDDILHGQEGDDLIFGGNGNDTVFGGLGNDTLIGGAGADTFIFNDGLDVINGYVIGTDELHLDASVLWANSNLTEQQVIDRFVTVIEGNVVFDFGAGNVITLNGVTSTVGLAEDLLIA